MAQPAVRLSPSIPASNGGLRPDSPARPPIGKTPSLHSVSAAGPQPQGADGNKPLGDRSAQPLPADTPLRDPRPPEPTERSDAFRARTRDIFNSLRDGIQSTARSRSDPRDLLAEIIARGRRIHREDPGALRTLMAGFRDRLGAPPDRALCALILRQLVRAAGDGLTHWSVYGDNRDRAQTHHHAHATGYQFMHAHTPGHPPVPYHDGVITELMAGFHDAIGGAGAPAQTLAQCIDTLGAIASNEDALGVAQVFRGLVRAAEGTRDELPDHALSMMQERQQAGMQRLSRNGHPIESALNLLGVQDPGRGLSTEAKLLYALRAHQPEPPKGARNDGAKNDTTSTQTQTQAATTDDVSNHTEATRNLDKQLGELDGAGNAHDALTKLMDAIKKGNVTRAHEIQHLAAGISRRAGGPQLTPDLLRSLVDEVAHACADDTQAVAFRSVAHGLLEGIADGLTPERVTAFLEPLKDPSISARTVEAGVDALRMATQSLVNRDAIRSDAQNYLRNHFGNGDQLAKQLAPQPSAQRQVDHKHAVVPHATARPHPVTDDDPNDRPSQVVKRITMTIDHQERDKKAALLAGILVELREGHLTEDELRKLPRAMAATDIVSADDLLKYTSKTLNWAMDAREITPDQLIAFTHGVHELQNERENG